MSTTKGRQISVRVASERIREREQGLLEMFNEAAADVTEEDIAEREALLGGFAGGPADCHQFQ